MKPLYYCSEQPVILFHVTTESCVNSIQQKGILPSEYGDLPVHDNDGFGVYALSSYEKAKEYASENITDEPQYVVSFLYNGKWFMCIDEILTLQETEEGKEKYHIGFIVIPEAIPASQILNVSRI